MDFFADTIEFYAASIAFFPVFFYNKNIIPPLKRKRGYMNAKKIGALIKKLRLENSMTQAQLAEKLAVSDKTVSKWERGVSQS